MKQKKKKRKEVRFNEEELEILNIKAKQHNMNISEYIRFCIAFKHENDQIHNLNQIFNNNLDYFKKTIEVTIDEILSDEFEFLFKKILNETIKEGNYVIQKKRK